MIFDSIKKLIVYGIETGLIEDEDRVYKAYGTADSETRRSKQNFLGAL